jgi:hypothetical protein
MTNYIEQTISEPAIMLFLGFGIMGLAGTRRKMKSLKTGTNNPRKAGSFGSAFLFLELTISCLKG